MQSSQDFDGDLLMNQKDRALRLPPDDPEFARGALIHQTESLEWEYELGEEYEYEYVEGLWNEYNPVVFAETADENSLDVTVQETSSGPIIYLPESAQQPNYINTHN